MIVEESPDRILSDAIDVLSALRPDTFVNRTLEDRLRATRRGHRQGLCSEAPGDECEGVRIARRVIAGEL